MPPVDHAQQAVQTRRRLSAEFDRMTVVHPTAEESGLGSEHPETLLPSGLLEITANLTIVGVVLTLQMAWLAILAYAAHRFLL